MSPERDTKRETAKESPIPPGTVVPGTSVPIASPSAATAPETASAVAEREEAREKPAKATQTAGEHPKDAKADILEGAKPTGLQKEPALVGPQGSIPGNLIASPSGPVPIGTVTDDPKVAEEIKKQLLEQDPRGRGAVASDYEALSEDQVARMSAAELRAVAFDRGYDLRGEHGQRVTRREFLRAQDEDEGISKRASKRTKKDEKKDE